MAEILLFAGLLLIVTFLGCATAYQPRIHGEVCDSRQVQEGPEMAYFISVGFRDSLGVFDIEEIRVPESDFVRFRFKTEVCIVRTFGDYKLTECE